MADSDSYSRSDGSPSQGKRKADWPSSLWDKKREGLGLTQSQFWKSFIPWVGWRPPFSSCTKKVIQQIVSLCPATPPGRDKGTQGHRDGTSSFKVILRVCCGFSFISGCRRSAWIGEWSSRGGWSRACCRGRSGLSFPYRLIQGFFLLILHIHLLFERDTVPSPRSGNE